VTYASMISRNLHAIDVDMVRRVESLLIRPLLKTSVTPRNA